MNKLIKVSSASIVSFGLAFSVLAQSPTPSPTATPSPTRTPTREEIKEEMEDIREDAKKAMEEARESTKRRIEEEREEFKRKMEDAREDLKTRLEIKRELLKQSLRKVKDERKKNTTEKIDKSLDALNERMTDHFSDSLGKLEDVLVRIDERADRAAASRSLDMSSVYSAIASASRSINDAKAAVQAQAAKTYTINVTTEADLKEAVRKARQALHDDLRSVREKVKSARDAVHDAARAYAKAHGRDLPKPTPTPTLTPTPTATVSPTTTP